MEYTVTINCDGAAFEDLNYEISTILARLAKDAREGDPWDGKIMDSNGNVVGEARLERD